MNKSIENVNGNSNCFINTYIKDQNDKQIKISCDAEVYNDGELYNEIKECNDTNYVVGISFSLYENGEVTKSMYFEEYYNTKTDEEITELEREEVREGRRLFDEIMASLEEEKKITIDSVEYNDRIGTISLEELLRP